MLKKIIKIFKKFKLKKELKVLQNKLLKAEIEIGLKALDECENLALTINESILSINKNYLLLEKEFFAKQEEIKGKEEDLKYFQRDYDEKYTDFKSKLTLLNKKLKIVLKEMKINREKYKVRLEKEKEIQKKFRVLTMFHDKDMNKTLTNLQEFFESNTKEKITLASDISKYKEKIAKIKREKTINIAKVHYSLKKLNSESKTMQNKIELFAIERDLLFAEIGRKIAKYESCPETLFDERNKLLKIEDNIKNIKQNISLL